MDREPQLENYRPLLRILARKLDLDDRFSRRFDSSDLVQETYVRAYASLAGFRGEAEPQVLAWLQQILQRVAQDQIRHVLAGKRDLDLEQSLEHAVAESTTRLQEYLAASDGTPSELAQRREELLRLADAIDQLPEEQRDVLICRDLNGTAVSRIAEQLGRTEKSVAGLLWRARRRLRELLDSPSSSG